MEGVGAVFFPARMDFLIGPGSTVERNLTSHLLTARVEGCKVFFSLPRWVMGGGSARSSSKKTTNRLHMHGSEE